MRAEWFSEEAGSNIVQVVNGQQSPAIVLEAGAEALVPSQPSIGVSQTRFLGVLGGI